VEHIVEHAIFALRLNDRASIKNRKLSKIVMKKEQQKILEIAEQHLSELDLETIAILEQMPELQHLQRADFVNYCKAMQQFATIICTLPKPQGTTFTFIKSSPSKKLQAA
jgi:hypothetical protein